jgi:hypothetical protein
MNIELKIKPQNKTPAPNKESLLHNPDFKKWLYLISPHKHFDVFKRQLFFTFSQNTLAFDIAVLAYTRTISFF